jgi:hypothetical protein
MSLLRCSAVSYICHQCGLSHEDIPLSFAADFPDQYANMSSEDRDNRSIIGSDQCIINSEAFYVRGLLEIPILDSDDKFLWGLWASVKEEVFDELSDSWEEQGRESRRGPFKARLGNKLAVYPDTFNLKMTIKVQPVGTRPLFFIDEENHPLAIAQRVGMSANETQELVSRLLHPSI